MKYSVEFRIETGEIAAPSPKCYMAHNEKTGECKLGSKGIPRRAKLQLDNYLSKMYAGTDHSVTLRSLRMINNRMTRTVQDCKAINDLFYKFAVHNDRISCSPLCEEGQILYLIVLYLLE